MVNPVIMGEHFRCVQGDGMSEQKHSYNTGKIQTAINEIQNR